ncbi:hypothetical protein GQ457_07G009650 [Hibiscus cannabinus]
MDSEPPSTALAPPIFDGVNFHVWTARMEAHLEANDLWEAVEEYYEVPPLPGTNQESQGEEVKEIKGKSHIKMKDSYTVKEYFDKLLAITNKVRLLGSEFLDSSLVQKILVTVPKKFEATISTLENTKDMPKIGLIDLKNSLQAQELRRLMRSEGSIEGALDAKAQYGRAEKWKKYEK